MKNGKKVDFEENMRNYLLNSKYKGFINEENSKSTKKEESEKKSSQTKDESLIAFYSSPLANVKETLSHRLSSDKMQVNLPVTFKST